MLEAERLDVSERSLDLQADLGPLVGVDALEVVRDRGPERVRVLALLDTEDAVELVGPVDLVLRQAPLPAAEVGDPLGVGHQFSRGPELLGRPLGDIHAVLDPCSVVRGRETEQALRWPVPPYGPPGTARIHSDFNVQKVQEGGDRTFVRQPLKRLGGSPKRGRKSRERTAEAAFPRLAVMANKLAEESSPYLLQHADNPVDWYPWGEEALSRSRSEDMPILLSIGYSSCHWCHVMERESFEDEETAAYMNEHFVCIKVDREERPDVDAIYMEAVQAMTGTGAGRSPRSSTPGRRPSTAAPTTRRSLAMGCRAFGWSWRPWSLHGRRSATR